MCFQQVESNNNITCNTDLETVGKTQRPFSDKFSLPQRLADSLVVVIQVET